MIRLSKSLSSYGATAVIVAALGVIVLGTPRVAHAIAATLVQVTNTAANPAIAQSPNTQAAQLIRLQGYSAPGTASDFQETPLSSHPISGSYTVPVNQSLVITSVDISPQCASSTFVQLFAVDSKSWAVTGPNTTHFDYPSGLVVGPGLTPNITVPANATCDVVMDVMGYLTSN